MTKIWTAPPSSLNAVFNRTNKTIAYIENNGADDMVKRKYPGRVIENLKVFNADANDGYVDVAYYQTVFEHTYQIVRGLHNGNLNDYVKNNIGNPSTYRPLCSIPIAKPPKPDVGHGGFTRKCSSKKSAPFLTPKPQISWWLRPPHAARKPF
ncbi:MAG: hypothetical protein IPN26_10710 [Bacteroidetes bacterium]|nr:hypothetical protein [Bacteroidota bacterium]